MGSGLASTHSIAKCVRARPDPATHPYCLPSAAVVRRNRTTAFSTNSPSSKMCLMCSLIGNILQLFDLIILFLFWIDSALRASQ
jgi:hypothetical protein